MDVNEVYLPEKETRLASSVAVMRHGTAGLPVSFPWLQRLPGTFQE